MLVNGERGRVTATAAAAVIGTVVGAKDSSFKRCFVDLAKHS